MNTLLYRCAAIWTVIGLVSGLGYRELTRAQGWEGRTQLAVVHTHTLVLGTIFFLLLLALNEVFRLEEERNFRIGVGALNVGLAITTTMLAVKGSLQVLGNSAADSPAISPGVSVDRPPALIAPIWAALKLWICSVVTLAKSAAESSLI